MDKIWAATLVIPLFILFMFNLTANQLFFMEYGDINNDLYTYCNIMSKEGTVSKNVLNDLEKELSKHGSFQLKIVATSYETGKILEGAAVVNTNLRREGLEKLILSVEYDKPHIWSFFLNRNLWGQKIDDKTLKLGGTVSTYIR